MSHRPPSLHRRHYTHRVAQVKRLLAAGDEAGAERVLLEIIDETELCDAGAGVAPWYYEQLAVLYRRQGRGQHERAILKRFLQQPHARGAKPMRLAARLMTLLAAI